MMNWKSSFVIFNLYTYPISKIHVCFYSNLLKSIISTPWCINALIFHRINFSFNWDLNRRVAISRNMCHAFLVCYLEIFYAKEYPYARTESKVDRGIWREPRINRSFYPWLECHRPLWHSSQSHRLISIAFALRLSRFTVI